jgi:hypothetical protein
MKGLDQLKSLRHNSGIQIDREALVELLALRKRVLKTFRLIGPVLKLVRDEDVLGQIRHLRTVELLSLEGKQMVDRFASLCTNLYSYSGDRHPLPPPKHLDAATKAARKNPIPETRLGRSGNKSKRRSATL